MKRKEKSQCEIHGMVELNHKGSGRSSLSQVTNNETKENKTTKQPKK